MTHVHLLRFVFMTLIRTDVCDLEIISHLSVVVLASLFAFFFPATADEIILISS